MCFCLLENVTQLHKRKSYILSLLIFLLHQSAKKSFHNYERYLPAWSCYVFVFCDINTETIDRLLYECIDVFGRIFTVAQNVMFMYK